MLVGYVDEIDPRGVAGWAADTEIPNSVVEILIYVDGKRLTKVACDRFREDFRVLQIYGEGRHAFSHTFAEPLPLHLVERVSVRFVRTGQLLPKGEARLSERQGLGAIMVTAPGRSGTTLMMSRLAQSPQICVAETPPFEVRHISYWATVVSTLMRAADYERSMHPDQLEGDGFKVGSNPFSHQLYSGAFQSQEIAIEYFNAYCLAEFDDLARKLIVEYYLRVRDDQSKQTASLFAEKCNNLHRPTRLFARRVFPNLKEILLIRDPRDLLCSQLSYFRADPNRTLQGIAHATEELARIKREESDRVVFGTFRRHDPECRTGVF